MKGTFQFVLIVEKETVFFRLRESAFCQPHQCLLVTGKGYPCLSTRHFLDRVHTYFPHVPMYCLVDADVYGADIFCRYKFGSRRQPREAAVALTELQLLGLHLSHFDSLSAASDDTKLIDFQACTIPLSEKSGRKLEKLLTSREAKADYVLKQFLLEIKTKGYLIFFVLYNPTLHDNLPFDSILFVI